MVSLNQIRMNFAAAPLLRRTGSAEKRVVVMTGSSRIHKSTSINHMSNQKEMNHSSHEVGDQDCSGEFAMLPDTAIAAMFAPHKTWLRMLHEHNSAVLNSYKEVFWFVPSFCLFPLEFAHRSFATHIECHQCIIESIEQSSQALNFTGMRIERTHLVVREPVDSIEHAMDIAIGAEGVPWADARAARVMRAA
jgi:hypothetical protein